MDISLEHPFFNAKKQLLKLTQSLFSRTGIKFVVHTRYFYDGKCILLSNENEFDCHCLQLDQLPRLEELYANQSHYLFLSSDLMLPEFAIYPEMFIENIKLAGNFDLYHRLFVVFNMPTYVETFEFGIGNCKKNAAEFFMNQIKILERFCIYFREANQQLITQMENNKVVFDAVADSVLFRDMEFKNTIDYIDLLKDIKLKSYRVQGNTGMCSLSEREFECLLWSAKNKTAKEIARILSLSPRTVEEYLLNVKNKLGCQSRFEIIDLALKNPIVKSFVD